MPSHQHAQADELLENPNEWFGMAARGKNCKTSQHSIKQEASRTSKVQ